MIQGFRDFILRGHVVEEAKTRACLHGASDSPIAATRCPNCTSQLS